VRRFLRTNRPGAVAFCAGGEENVDPLFQEMKGLLGNAPKMLGCWLLEL